MAVVRHAEIIVDAKEECAPADYANVGVALAARIDVFKDSLETLAHAQRLARHLDLARGASSRSAEHIIVAYLVALFALTS